MCYSCSIWIRRLVLVEYLVWNCESCCARNESQTLRCPLAPPFHSEFERLHTELCVFWWLWFEAPNLPTVIIGDAVESINAPEGVDILKSERDGRIYVINTVLCYYQRKLRVLGNDELKTLAHHVFKPKVVDEARKMLHSIWVWRNLEPIQEHVVVDVMLEPSGPPPPLPELPEPTTHDTLHTTVGKSSARDHQRLR